MSPRTEQVSIYLRYISGGVTKETFIGYSLRPSKTVTALVHYYFFSLAGPRDKQVVFAIRAKLGLTPQMDVRPYAYGYLGIHLSNTLNWRAQNKAASTKAQQTLGVIRRNLNKCSTHIKAVAYTSLVRPILEYASAAWDPHSQNNIKTLERIQRHGSTILNK